MTTTNKNLIESRYCQFCKEFVEGRQEEFRDFLSLKEFVMSGLCQKCQDKIFNDVE